MSPSVHASAVAVRLNGQWMGVMFRGPSGAGKSDMTMRMMALGAKLVGDDRLHIWPDKGGLYARSPDRIAGLLEIRGLGISAYGYVPCCRIRLAVELQDTPPERMPEARTTALCGIDVPHLALDPRTPSAATLVMRALEAL